MSWTVLGPVLALLPPVSVAVLVAVALPRRIRQLDPFARRQAFLDGATVAALFLTLATELLGSLGSLSRGPIAVAWAVLVATGLAFWLPRRAPASWPTAPRGAPAALWAGVTAIALVTLVTALSAPPNTWDSMTYHMSRVVHWLQQGNVAFFPTANLRELYMPPWVEYGILHLHALWGGDRLANLVQWATQAGSIVGVSLAAARLGAGPKGQAVAAVFAATIPMGVLQASSTQTDDAVSFWIVALVCHGLRAEETAAPADLLLAGGALGLAVLTKPTAYFFVPPVVVWLGVRVLRRHGARVVPAAMGAAVLALVVNLPFFARTAALWGSPFGPAGRQSRTGVVAAGSSPAVPASEWFVARAFKNVALHLGTPFGPLNKAVERSIRAADRWARTWQDVVPPTFRIEASPHEDRAGSPLQLVLLTGLLLATRDRRGVLGLATALLAGGLIFVSQFPWQPFNARLHLPLFVLAAPIAGLLLERARWAWIGGVTAGALLLGSVPWLLRGLPRRLVGAGASVNLPRERQYFLNDPLREARLVEEARRVSALGCRSVGLVGGEDTWEYPLWVLTHAADAGITFRHTQVRNLSAAIPDELRQVDCVCDLDAGGCVRTAVEGRP